MFLPFCWETKILALQGKESIPNKVYVHNRILEKVNKFTYLGYTLSYEGQVDISNKTAKYTKTTGIKNNVLKPCLVWRHTWVCLYRVLAWPTLCYGSKAWTIRKEDSNGIIACEMKFIQRTAGFTKWDHRRTEEILNKLKIKSMTVYIQNYQKWRNMWPEWIQGESQNKFHVISQEDKHQLDIQWREKTMLFHVVLGWKYLYFADLVGILSWSG
jgi:hypothetical protein